MFVCLYRVRLREVAEKAKLEEAQRKEEEERVRREEDERVRIEQARLRKEEEERQARIKEEEEERLRRKAEEEERVRKELEERVRREQEEIVEEARSALRSGEATLQGQSTLTNVFFLLLMSSSCAAVWQSIPKSTLTNVLFFVLLCFCLLRTLLAPLQNGRLSEATQYASTLTNLNPKP